VNKIMAATAVGFLGGFVSYSTAYANPTPTKVNPDRKIREMSDDAVEYHRLPDGRILTCYVVGLYSVSGNKVRAKSCDWANVEPAPRR
jgi:hypothetical protein